MAVSLAKDLILENRRGDGSTIYVGTLSNALKAPLANGGFALGPGETVILFTCLFNSNSTTQFLSTEDSQCPRGLGGTFLGPHWM